MNFIRTVIHIIFIRPILHVFFGVNIVGRENLEGIDNFILFANHNSHLDIFLLFSILPHNKINQTHPLAALDYFQKPVWIYKAVDFLFQPIWVDRTAAGCSVIKEVKQRLEQKHSIIIFPEGTRGLSGEIQEFHEGIGFIVKKNPNTPIVPVFLEGPERIFPKKTFIPIPLWNHITISSPQVFQGDFKEITDNLHSKLIKLSEEERALKHQRRGIPQKPCIIAIIGIDGSGKSTLSRQAINHFDEECCFIGDTIELFKNGKPYSAQPLITNKIRIWIGQKAKKAKNLAHYKIPKLIELLLRDHLLLKVARWYRSNLIFLDGAPLLNMTAWACLFREKYFTKEVCMKAIGILTRSDHLSKNNIIFKQYPELAALRKLKLNHLHMPDIVFFLDIDPKVSIQRITSRGEDIQAHENLEKLTKLRNAYQLVCDVISQSRPVCKLNANQDIDTLSQLIVKFIQDVRKESNNAEN